MRWMMGCLVFVVATFCMPVVAMADTSSPLAQSQVVHVTGGYMETVTTQKYEQTGTHSVWVQTGTKQVWVQTGTEWLYTPCVINGIYIQVCGAEQIEIGHYVTEPDGHYETEPTYGYVTVQTQQWVPVTIS
ncbi:hypothetical protein [Alicyclobacillus fodiniaquatilis]|uniref:Uncharacterized protein n=1 Tax=Alicyclobacillus fodiniaquatilis TaxID=1661150 RepID=A0ABW4JHB4_9BACL